MAENELAKEEYLRQQQGAIELNSPDANEQILPDNSKDEIRKTGISRSESCNSILLSNGMSKMRNLSRRVSFPADDKLISGYNEPRNPWENAHDTTTEELIQSYTQACQAWNVRPITKLLVQLQEIKDFTVRTSSLTLKGERLECRVIETLESIFKRVQFITIDLEATNLDEDSGAALFDMIEYYESAVNVLVGFNKNLGNRGWQAAAHMMRKMSCLRLFDGHSVPMSIQASPFVGRALRLSNTLVTLHLENAMLSGRPILLIVAALRMNITLRELFLADNRLSPLDALQLANLLKFNRVLQLLDLRNNPIQDMGLGHLCAGLMAQSSSPGINGMVGGIQTLVLWNNQMSHEGMVKLAMALRYTVSLSTLNLGQNVLGDDGILKLKEGLLQNHSLLRLGLVGAKLTDEGGVAIAEYLAESPRIIRLDLRNNDIKVAGLMALSLAFKINNSLLRLDIDKPNKKDSLKELAAKQESLMNDMVSYAQRNKELSLEKAQRQQEAKEAGIKQQENGLRYMDMTNSSTGTTSTPPVSTETSVNNSNNLGANAEIDNKNEDTNHDQKRVFSSIPSFTDDSPENSPEFLPSGSVSYHQVSPVMLSGSEMVKRAAATKLKTLLEHHNEDSLPSSDRDRGSKVIIGKLVENVFNGAKLQLSGKTISDEGNENKSCDIKDSKRNDEITGFANNLTANVLGSITGDDVNTGAEKIAAMVDVVNGSTVEPSGAVISIVMENDELTVASSEIGDSESESTEGTADGSEGQSDLISDDDTMIENINQITDDEKSSDSGESPLREFPSSQYGQSEFLGFGSSNADILNGNVPSDSDSENSNGQCEEISSKFDENAVDYASTIVTGIFQDMGLLEKSGSPEGSNDADICNGNIRLTRNHSQGLDNIAISKADSDSGNNGVNFEVSHFELSKFPSAN